MMGRGGLRDPVLPLPPHCLGKNRSSPGTLETNFQWGSGCHHMSGVICSVREMSTSSTDIRGQAEESVKKLVLGSRTAW